MLCILHILLYSSTCLLDQIGLTSGFDMYGLWCCDSEARGKIQRMATLRMLRNAHSLQASVMTHESVMGPNVFRDTAAAILDQFNIS